MGQRAPKPTVARWFDGRSAGVCECSSGSVEMRGRIRPEARILTCFHQLAARCLDPMLRPSKASCGPPVLIRQEFQMKTVIILSVLAFATVAAAPAQARFDRLNETHVGMSI